MVTFSIREDDLSGEPVRELLREHLHDVTRHAPPESNHALDVNALRDPAVTFWSAWADDRLVACGALLELTPVHGEIKSMRTATDFRRQGAGAAILSHLIATARSRGYERVSLETGSSDAFSPAHALYRRFGFVPCEPFADYRSDPHSIFMTLLLGDATGP